MTAVAELLAALEQLAPPALAAPGPRTGLLAGDPVARVTSAMLALDALPETVADAAERGADALITCHAPPGDPAGPLTPEIAWGATLRESVARVVAVIALEDRLRRAFGDRALASALGLRDIEPLAPLHPSDGTMVKLAVFVPPTHLDAVRDALCAAGAGHIGAYEWCSFAAPGTGTYRPLEGAQPFVGETGRLERAEELRLEVLVPAAKVATALAAMRRAHPYEEAAYDLYPVWQHLAGGGVGRVGMLSEPMAVGYLRDRVRGVLDTPWACLSGQPDRMVTCVAVVCGRGEATHQAARAVGAEALITGDITYRAAQAARFSGLVLIDPGQPATERPGLAALREALASAMPAVEFALSAVETTPWQEPHPAEAPR